MTISNIIAFLAGYVIGGIAYAIVAYKDEQMKCDSCGRNENDLFYKCPQCGSHELIVIIEKEK